MKYAIYRLDDRKRLLAFPYPLQEAGWLPNHRSEHRNNCLRYTFFCLSFRGERTMLGMLPHGTVLNSGLGALHDELFFSYAPEVAERWFALLGSSARQSWRVTPGEREQGLIREIQRSLESLAEPGAADRLDRLAFSLICELVTQPENRGEAGRLNLRIQEAAAALEKGRALPEVIASLGFSRRNFYREWSRVFSVSPGQYLLERKLDRAESLLLNTRLSVKEIAAECGFSTPSRFCAQFRESRGKSPLERREECFRLYP